MGQCGQCGVGLPSKAGRPAKFCGEPCRRAWWSVNSAARSLHNLTCESCGAAFQNRRKQPYCTLECANRAAADAETERRAAVPLTTVWSCGGGVQSTAIAALIVRGALPKPDYAIMVDVGREKASTWAYVHGTLRPALAAAGVDLVIIETQNTSVYSGDVLLIPAYRKAGDTGGIKFRTFCSATWKQHTTARWLRARGVERFEAWVGISADEAHRIRDSRNRWAQVRYPLVERCLDKADCLRLAKEQGWPQPPRTSCWMCPSMADAEWVDMRDHWPEDWARAVAFERELQKKDPAVSLHRQMIPLADVTFNSERPTNQRKLFMGACDGSECVECKL